MTGIEVSAIVVVALAVGALVGVVTAAQVMHRHVTKYGAFRFKWRGKRLCVKGQRHG